MGLKAIRATDSPFRGAGVTVAVLDTGIDSTHPAFTGISFGAHNLCDFTSDDAGIAGSATDRKRRLVPASMVESGDTTSPFHQGSRP